MTQAMSNPTSNPTQSPRWGLIDTAIDCNARLMNIALDNISANFDYAGKLAKIRSPSDFIDVTSNHLRDRFETISEQMEEITALIQRSEPEALREAENAKATFFE